MTDLSVEHAQIRNVTYADLSTILRWRNDWSVRQFMYTQHEITPEEHRSWFDRMSVDPSTSLLIFEFNGKSEGFVKFRELRHPTIASWGFYLVPEGPKGIGRKFANAALRYAFQERKFKKLCGEAIASNERSIRFHEAVGFRREGVLRSQHFDGERYCDVICFGLMRAEWSGQQE